MTPWLLSLLVVVFTASAFVLAVSGTLQGWLEHWPFRTPPALPEGPREADPATLEELEGWDETFKGICDFDTLLTLEEIDAVVEKAVSIADEWAKIRKVFEKTAPNYSTIILPSDKTEMYNPHRFYVDEPPCGCDQCDEMHQAKINLARWNADKQMFDSVGLRVPDASD